MKYKCGYLGLITYHLLDNPIKSCLLLFFVIIGGGVVSAQIDREAELEIVADILHSFDKDAELLWVSSPRSLPWSGYSYECDYLERRLGRDYVNVTVEYSLGGSIMRKNIVEITRAALENTGGIPTL